MNPSIEESIAEADRYYPIPHTASLAKIVRSYLCRAYSVMVDQSHTCSICDCPECDTRRAIATIIDRCGCTFGDDQP